MHWEYAHLIQFYQSVDFQTGWYQEVDFDNDNRMDIVVYNKLGMGHGIY